MEINVRSTTKKWRLNDNMIKKEQDIIKLREMTKEYFKFNDTPETTPKIIWDSYKAVARGFFIQQKAIKNKYKYQRVKELQTEIDRKEMELKTNPGNEKILKQLGVLKNQKKNWELDKLANQIKWTKQYGYENANKPGKWLSRLIRKKRDAQQILQIKLKDREINTDKEIREEFKKYYKELYDKDQISQDDIVEYLCQQKLQKITDEQRLNLNKVIDIDEIKKAIKDLDANKAPGPDGFIAGFYKLEQDVVLQHLKKIMNLALTDKTIPDTWKEAEIIMIHKEGKDPSDVRNYRPISLLNTDYKIFTKILANRLTEFLQTWIEEDQTGFLPNRSTKDNVRIIVDAIEYYDQNCQKEVGFLSLDAEKAFDKLNWDFVKLLLKELDFGMQFINGIQSIYNQQKAKLRINGEITEEFEIKKGTRQGCPLSPLIFILAIEILLRSIRKDPNLKGIKIDKQEIKIRAFVDDLICIVENPKSKLKDWLEKIEKFGKLAGVSINKDKTVILTKNISLKDQEEIKRISGLEIVKKIKYLGIWIGVKNNQLLELNYSIKWKEIKKDLENWKDLNLSLLGRIATVKTNILPKLLYLFRNIPIIRNMKLINGWNKEISRFIWKNKKPRIKLAIMITPKSKGGFGLPDFKLYHEACTLDWIMDWVKLEKIKILTLEGYDLRKGWHSYLWCDQFKTEKNFGNHFIRSSLIKTWIKYKRYFYGKTPLWFSPLEAHQRRLLGWNNWPTYREILKKPLRTEETPQIEELKELQKGYSNVSWYQYLQIKESFKKDKEVGFNLCNGFWDNILLRKKKS
uniref:Reverse transcriptase domain-containing protein n=1 Tax=Anolis carolinensis TaxID=28377 RepID=A0A803SQE2_ANOCA